MALANNSEVATETATIACFLDISQKFTDWRHEAYEILNMSSSKDDKKVIYWIGTLDLKQVSKGLIAPLYFTVNGFKLVKDSFVDRAVNGSPANDKRTKSAYRYDFNYYELGARCMNNYLRGILKIYHYLHIFLEEIVEKDGRHCVYMLYNTPSDSRPAFYGTPSNVHWSKFPYEQIAWARKTNIYKTGMGRALTLAEKPYTWVEG